MNATKTHIERAVLMPSIGDDVLFRLNGQKLTTPALATVDNQPLHAKVCYVWSPHLVNLLVVDHYGNTRQLTSVNFVAPGSEIPMIGAFCELDTVLGEELVDGVDLTDTDGIVAANPERPMTFGEKAVGLEFNPSNQTEVYKAKSECARVIDRAHNLIDVAESGDVIRMARLAITAAQEAQMWLVKA